MPGFYKHADGIYIEDLNSTNFTFLNRIRLQPGQAYPLKDGDEIRLGVLTLEYRFLINSICFYGGLHGDVGGSYSDRPGT